MTLSDMNQNLTDRVGGQPILDPNGTMRKGSKDKFSLETKRWPKFKGHPLFRRE